LSWGSNDASTISGYIAINGNRVVNTPLKFCTTVCLPSDYAGFNLVELNVSSCSASNIRHYDTSAKTANSENMATYINSLPLNTVLIGVTAEDAQRSLTSNARSLTSNAKSALLTIGVDVSELQEAGKLSFVVQIGQPTLTASEVADPSGYNLKLTVNLTGTS
jgi:Interleukin-like EMT inducer